MENIPIVKVIKPRPPSWISARIITWPVIVKSLPVSSTARPVTQTAEFDVKSASINDIPCTVEQGVQEETSR